MATKKTVKTGSRTGTSIKSRKSIFMIKQLLAEQPRNLALFVCGINWGLRGQDLLALQWKDLLTPEGEMKKIIQITESKTGKTRQIMVNKKVHQVLETLLKARIEAKSDSGPFVFPSKKFGKNKQARTMTNTCLHQLVVKWTKTVGLPGRYGGHSLRKTFGYWVYRECGSLAVLMELFGHSSERMTKKYIGITDEMQNSLYCKVNL